MRLYTITYRLGPKVFSQLRHEILLSPPAPFNILLNGRKVGHASFLEYYKAMERTIRLGVLTFEEIT